MEPKRLIQPYAVYSMHIFLKDKINVLYYSGAFFFIMLIKLLDLNLLSEFTHFKSWALITDD